MLRNKKKTILDQRIWMLFLLLAVSYCFIGCPYMKKRKPADVNKAEVVLNNAGEEITDRSCWLATAANMLAGADYGVGSDIQDRADYIYKQLTTKFGYRSGFINVALKWWLKSDNNLWKQSNDYKLVYVLGNHFIQNEPYVDKYPWADPDGAMIIANHLRNCKYVGITISWPWDDAATQAVGMGAHALTCWGDNRDKGLLFSNPEEIRVTDSDDNSEDTVQVYTYDDFYSPNPGQPNEGNGWYFNLNGGGDLSDDNAYIVNMVALSDTDLLSSADQPGLFEAFYEPFQPEQEAAAGMTYDLSSAEDIFDLETSIETAGMIETQKVKLAYNISEYDIEWDFVNSPVQINQKIILSSRLVLPSLQHSIKYQNVHFTYATPGLESHFPSISLTVKTPFIQDAERIPFVTGGYLIGSYDIYAPTEDISGKEPIAKYRFIHQYCYDQDPERHQILISGSQGYVIANLRFGHSYGYLDKKSLQDFKPWMTQFPQRTETLGSAPIKITLDWEGRLPYPKIEMYIPSKPPSK